MKLEPHFHVSSQSSQFDQKIDISIHGLRKETVVTVYAVVHVKTFAFESFAKYKTNAQGSINFNEQPSLGGSFTGMYPMGLLWSLQPEEVSKHRFAEKYACRSKMYSLYVYESEIDDIAELRSIYKTDQTRFSAQVCLERRFMASGVRRIEVNENGIVGVLFLPPADSTEQQFPGIVNLLGGYPGTMEFKSALQASHGFASLALAYFGVDHLPKCFTKTLDLEYFEKAVQFMKNHPSVRGDKGIGVVGNCKGAQIALAMASCLKDVRCVVWNNCSINAACGSIKYKDKYWPQMELDCSKIKKEPVELRDCFTLPKHGTAHELPSTFPFYKKHKTAYLFIAGWDDRCAPAKFCAEEARILLEKFEHPDYEILDYPKAGHIMEPKYSPHCSMFYQTGKDLGFYMGCGGEMIAHCEAQNDAWDKQLAFLKDKLRC